MFGPHLWHYSTDKYIQADSVVMSYKDDKYKEFDLAIDNVLAGEPDGLLKEIMIYRFLRSLSKDAPSDFIKLWEKRRDVIKNSVLIEELDHRVSEIQNAKDYEAGYLSYFSSEDEDFEGDLFTHLLQLSEKQPLYVDLWATWCGYCHREVPHLTELEKKFSEKQFKFVTVCCKSEKHTWRSMVKKLKMSGEHYFLDEMQSDKLRANLQYAGYPTYMILNKGKIVDADAARPSSGNTIFERLNALVER
jgi:thiol-disulfide isomerase/thioredoxin